MNKTSVFRSRITFTCFLIALPLAGMPKATLAQDVEASLEQARQAVHTAAANQLNLISPEHYEKALEKLSDAEDLYQRGSSIADIRRKLDECRAELGQARTFEEVGRIMLEQSLDARGAALEANAPEFAPEEWKDAREELYRAGRAVEKGDQSEARQRAAEATQRFQIAEIEAVRRDVIGRANQLQEEARRRDADDKARLTYARADSLLTAAENAVRSGRNAGRAEASQYAQAATEAYQHAARIAALADQVSRDEERQVELLVLAYEAELERIASALNYEPSFAAGPEPVADHAVAAVQSLYQDRENLLNELSANSEEVTNLRVQVESLETRLANLTDSEAQRRQRVTAELRAREIRESKINATRSVFLGTEAEVLVRGNELLIRLYGLSFPVASAEITPENFPLLTKLQSAIRAFPDIPVTIAGHSDAQGNDEYNQSLSERRAYAVRQYLLANMELHEEQIRAIGYGETQPLASNETVEGRAKNRRIDVVLTLD